MSSTVVKCWSFPRSEGSGKEGPRECPTGVPIESPVQSLGTEWKGGDQRGLCVGTVGDRLGWDNSVQSDPGHGLRVDPRRHESGPSADTTLEDVVRTGSRHLEQVPRVCREETRGVFQTGKVLRKEPRDWILRPLHPRECAGKGCRVVRVRV